MSTANGRYLVHEMLLDGYIYCGGQDYREGEYHSEGQIRHWNYYCLKSKSMVLPSIPNRQEQCVCEQKIWWQCYIMKKGAKPTDQMTIVGNCCIKPFTEGNLRTCSICGDPHRNRAYDLCDHHKKPVIVAERNVKRIAKQVHKSMNALMPHLEYYINMPNKILSNMLRRMLRSLSRAMKAIPIVVEVYIDDGIEDYLAQSIYLNVPYKDKEIAKNVYGCAWDKTFKKWYCSEDEISAIVSNNVLWCFNSFKHINGKRLSYIYE